MERAGTFNPFIAGSYDRWWASYSAKVNVGRTVEFDALPGSTSARQMTGHVVADEIIFAAAESADGTLTWDAVSSILDRHRDVHLDFLVRNANATYSFTHTDDEGETFLILKPGEWAIVRVGVYKDNTGHILATRAPLREHTADISEWTAMSDSPYWQNGTRRMLMLPEPASTTGDADAYTNGSETVPTTDGADWGDVDTKAQFAFRGTLEVDRDGPFEYNETIELEANGAGILSAGYELMLVRMRDGVKTVLENSVAMKELSGVGTSYRHHLQYHGKAKKGDVYMVAMDYGDGVTIALADLRAKFHRETYLEPEIALSYAAPTT